MVTDPRQNLRGDLGDPSEFILTDGQYNQTIFPSFIALKYHSLNLGPLLYGTLTPNK